MAIWAPNSAEWAVASLAIHGIGAVLVPVNTRFKGAEARYVLEAAGARLLLTVTGFLGTDYPALLAAAGTPAGLEVVELGALHEGVAAAASRAVADRAVAVTGADLTEIMFTSGTTGRPRAPCSRTGPRRCVFTRLGRLVGLRHGDRYLIVNPFFHTFGLKAGILVVRAGRRHDRAAWPVFDVPLVLATIAERAHHDAARRRRRCTRRSSTIPTSAGTTCRRCGWR